MLRWLINRIDKIRYNIVIKSDLYQKRCKQLENLEIMNASFVEEKEEYITGVVKQLATHGLYLRDGEVLTEVQYDALVKQEKNLYFEASKKAEGGHIRMLQLD